MAVFPRNRYEVLCFYVALKTKIMLERLDGRAEFGHKKTYRLNEKWSYAHIPNRQERW
jgi:hypothetical protein